MIIGAGGERLKRIGTRSAPGARALMDAKVFLELWVKVRSGWADDEAASAQLRLRMTGARAAPRRAPAARLTAYVLAPLRLERDPA